MSPYLASVWVESSNPTIATLKYFCRQTEISNKNRTYIRYISTSFKILDVICILYLLSKHTDTIKGMDDMLYIEKVVNN